MSEIRIDPLTNKKVIIVPKRMNKPCEFSGEVQCPFCKTNNLKEECLLKIEDDGDWNIKVVKNKFPIVENEKCLEKNDCIWSNFGFHEIVVETNIHNRPYITMTKSEFAKIYKVYMQRYLELSKYEDLKYISIFKNHGKNAGASLKHPHSHIVGLPFIPSNILEEMKCSKKYYRENQKCIFCDIIDGIIKDDKLKLIENNDFLVYVPFAGIQPYEFIIIPKVHKSSIIDITDEELSSLGEMLEWIFKRINLLLGDVDFNIMVHNEPIDRNYGKCYHWHLKITVRLSYLSGQESDAMIRMRTTYPEKIAEEFRNINI